MLLASLAPVRLECTLGHEKWLLLIPSTVLGQTMSINDGAAVGQRAGIGGSVLIYDLKAMEQSAKAAKVTPAEWIEGKIHAAIQP
jgi:hypothetical protein